ncbi:SusC/RagA family TonB-linked outer membrane protein [Pedobacter jamesrossensis]|uniref:SusC/RagA family TonB-linked outer membrane protein n=1 Tax=Pedobacter jamesrossensis TaxID=1908238 RepID=A0ABV8NLY9_9SPHI
MNKIYHLLNGHLKLLVFMCLLSTINVAVYAQQKTISGVVIDSADTRPLVGVSITIQGTKNVTQTDGDGKFRLNALASDNLVFQYLGFVTKVINIGNQSEFRVVLNSASQKLGEVVVVAFGTQKKVSVTGAINSIQTKEIKQSPAANLAVTLAGRLPGLTSIQKSGEPGRDLTNLYIRGQGTVNAQSPVVLVDGIERDLTYIDPNEVESVTILKDASSTAIFGVRGANGVILVTTKRGTSEKPSINFTTETGLQDFTRKLQPVNSYEFATLRNLAQQNDGLGPAFSPAALEHYRTGDDPVRYPNTNWRELLMKDYSSQSRYNLNVSGASKSMKYFINAGYLSQGGQFNTEKGLNYDPSFALDRYNFRSNIDVQLNSSLKAFLNVAGYLEKQNMPGGVLRTFGDRNSQLAGESTADFIFTFMNDMNSTDPGPLTPDGQVITNPIVPHPAYGQINRAGYTQQTRNNILASYGMEQTLDFITKGLSTKVIVSFDARSTNNLFATKSYQKFVQVIDPNTAEVSYRKFNADENTPLDISGSAFFTTLSNIQGYLNYNRLFGKHAVSGLVLYQQQKNIVDSQLPFNLRGAATRLTYAYDSRYLFEFNAGYNGSEQFVKGKRFGFFPALSAGWVISNESFLKDNKTISLLKLRGSYGEVGNDRIGGSRFLYLDDIIVAPGGGYSNSLGFGNTIVTNRLRNENLTWEVAKKANVGLEIGLFNALNLTVDVFTEKRDNILRRRGTIPTLNGLPISALPPVNIGVVQNRGFEAELNYKKVFNKDFSILTRANLSFARNKQLFADEPLLPASFAYRYRQTGYRIGQPFGYIVDRYFTSIQDIANSPVQSVGGHESRPGDLKFKDLNNDGVIDDKDHGPIGYSNVPEYQFGGAISINYKNFDLSALVQGVSNIYNLYAGAGTFEGTNYYSQHLESWTAERFASGAPINYPRLTTQTSPNQNYNSFFVIDASYVRLKNVELGYTLPTNWAGKVGAKNIRLYFNGLNLYTWDKLPTKNFDPELTLSGRGQFTYPITRVYNLGVNVTF